MQKYLYMLLCGLAAINPQILKAQCPDVSKERIYVLEFKLGSINIQEKESSFIDSTVVKYMRSNDSLYVHVKGFSESNESKDFNDSLLSDLRLKSVQNYLLKSGIDKNRIILENYGSSREWFVYSKGQHLNAVVAFEIYIDWYFINNK